MLTPSILFIIGFFYVAFQTKKTEKKTKAYVKGFTFIILSVLAKNALTPSSYSDIDYDLIDKIIALPFIGLFIWQLTTHLNQK